MRQICLNYQMDGREIPRDLLSPTKVVYVDTCCVVALFQIWDTHRKIEHEKLYNLATEPSL